MGTAKGKTKKEIWKSPPSLEKPWLEVSNMGIVRTSPHMTTAGHFCKRGGIKACSADSRGRPIVKFLNNKKPACRLLHSLVAECFLKGWTPKSFVYHLNGDQKDCRAENLVLGTREEKSRMQTFSGSFHKIVLKEGKKTAGEFFGCGEAGRFLGVSKQSVHNALLTGGRCKGFKVFSRKITEKERTRAQEENNKMMFAK